MPRLLVLVLLASTACAKVEPSDPVQAQVQALQVATDELKAARAAIEADGAATRDSLEKVRGELAATNAKLAELTTARDRSTPSHGSDFVSTLGGSGRPTAETEADIAAAVRCSSETRCTIDRGFMETMLANPATMARQVRIVPSMRDGVSRGYKLYGIRPGSLPKALGLKNGDLITAVNGNALGSLEEAMTLYTTLRTEAELTLAIDRRGTPLTLTLEIVEAAEAAETSGSSAP